MNKKGKGKEHGFMRIIEIEFLFLFFNADM